MCTFTCFVKCSIFTRESGGDLWFWMVWVRELNNMCPLCSNLSSQMCNMCERQSTKYIYSKISSSFNRRRCLLLLNQLDCFGTRNSSFIDVRSVWSMKHWVMRHSSYIIPSPMLISLYLLFLSFCLWIVRAEALCGSCFCCLIFGIYLLMFDDDWLTKKQC